MATAADIISAFEKDGWQIVSQPYVMQMGNWQDIAEFHAKQVRG